MANHERWRKDLSGPDRATRPIIVFVHGFLDAASVWETVQARLEAESISTRALHLPGMGGTLRTAHRYCSTAMRALSGLSWNRSVRQLR